MMAFLGILFVGGFIGWFSGILADEAIPNVRIGNFLAGLIGAWLGNGVLGQFGPETGGFYILPSLIGAVALCLLVSWIMSMTNNNS